MKPAGQPLLRDRRKIAKNKILQFCFSCDNVFERVFAYPA